MPQFPSADLFAGILAVLFLIVLRARAGKPRRTVWQLALGGVVAAFAVPLAFGVVAAAWRALPATAGLPSLTAEQVYIGAWAAVALLAIGHRPDGPPRISLRAGLLTGAAVALLLPPLLDYTTGAYQPMSLRPDLNHCTSGMLGQVQPREVANTCDEPITVGLCLPDEVNPAPCAQSHTLQPGETARFDPGAARLSSLPGNPGGLTVVACRPPARPSRMLSSIGRGYDGVCLPPG